jgi:hypothetical protein
LITEIDEALGNLLRSKVVPGGQVEVSFEPPTRDWAAGRNVPTVNAFLYDIREDQPRRSYGIVSVRDESGAVVKRQRPFRHFRLSYLLTCWTRRPEDEHRLLASVMGSMVATEVLPIEGDGPLASRGLPAELVLAAPHGDARSAAELWTALGGNLKPSLDLVVIAPYPHDSGTPAGPPVTEVGVIARRLHDPDQESPLRIRQVRR